MNPSIKQILSYEFKTSFAIFNKTTTWLTITAIALGFFALIKQYALAFICVLIIALLNIKLHKDSGEITNYFRQKNNIPTKSDIKRWKKFKKIETIMEN